ncbi:MAG TPA: VacB/RNase II family 3'-5' exoribonuclease, partial [Thermoanaerobaculia bacterium]|nr:VacB/RNase II family 3'-5' exoribonuclease [Thermoanaerobaculia bacterium]
MSIDEGLRTRLLEALERQGQRGATLDELAELSAPATASELPPALDELAGEGVAVEWTRRWYALRATPWRVGVLDRVSRRESVVRTDDGKRGATELTVAERDRGGARSGDRVLVRPVRKGPVRKEGPGGRARREAPAATVLRVLQARRRRLVGRLDQLERGWRLWSFAPGEALDAQDLVIADPGAAADGDYVVVELGRARRDGSVPASVVEVLGPIDEPGVDVEVVLRHFEIPEAFPADAEREAAALPAEVDPADLAERSDYRDDPTVTIDGETARDFDDAIWVSRRNDGWLVRVHIADVAHYVTPGSAIDRAAEHRGTSVYFPDRAVPMLPRQLSDHLCSLLPDRDRPTTSVELRFDRKARRLSSRVTAGVIRSHRRLTYRDAQEALDRYDQGGGSGDLPATVIESLVAARDLARALREMRAGRGALDFFLPEIHLELDPEGEVVDVRQATSFETHRLIEELMIAANEAVAERLAEDPHPADQARPLYRVHPPPKAADVEELREVCRALGVDLDTPQPEHGSAEGEPLGELAPVLAAARAAGIGPVIEGMALRALGRAVYSPECTGHSALAARHYCHFTSPIRRYPDLVVHRAVRGLAAPEAEDGAEARGQRLSQRERRAESAEREIRKWKKIRYLRGREGSSWAGTVSGVTDFGLFVVLDELGIDGLIPLDALTDDHYEYDARLHKLVGRGGGRILQLGDAVEVVLARVNEPQRRIDLSLAGMSPPRAESPRGRPRSERERGERGEGGRS